MTFEEKREIAWDNYLYYLGEFGNGLTVDTYGISPQRFEDWLHGQIEDFADREGVVCDIKYLTAHLDALWGGGREMKGDESKY